jgi:hypothetical protein
MKKSIPLVSYRNFSYLEAMKNLKKLFSQIKADSSRMTANEPNQWHTPVFVRVYTIDGHREREKHFSDLQMAWLWIRDKVSSFQEPENTLRSFAHTCRRLAECHADGGRGYIAGESTLLQYVVYYDYPYESQGNSGGERQAVRAEVGEPNALRQPRD